MCAAADGLCVCISRCHGMWSRRRHADQQSLVHVFGHPLLGCILAACRHVAVPGMAACERCMPQTAADGHPLQQAVAGLLCSAMALTPACCVHQTHALCRLGTTDCGPPGLYRIAANTVCSFAFALQQISLGWPLLGWLSAVILLLAVADCCWFSNTGVSLYICN